MLDCLFLNRSIILSVSDISMTTSGISRKLEISENQWCVIDILISLLKPLYYNLTTVLCKENHSPVSTVRPFLSRVIENHLKARDDDSMIIKLIKCYSMNV